MSAEQHTEGAAGDVSADIAVITRVLHAAARGNLSRRVSLIEINKESPVYEGAMAANLILDRMETLNREVLGAMSAAMEGRFYRSVIGKGLPGHFSQVTETAT